MQNLLKLWKDVYRTYEGDGERHLLRLSAIIVLSAVIASFAVKLGSSAVPAMSLCISVLAGFAFTALFSNHAMMASDLPVPANENDRRDLKTLRKLGENFRTRVRFFLILSVLDIVAILVLSLEMSSGWMCVHLIKPSNCAEVGSLFVHIPSLVRRTADFIESIGILVFRTVAFLFFFEILYTFYRLSETIMAVMDIRRTYLEARIDQ